MSFGKIRAQDTKSLHHTQYNLIKPRFTIIFLPVKFGSPRVLQKKKTESLSEFTA